MMLPTQEAYPMALFSHHLGKDVDLLRKAIDDYIVNVDVTSLDTQVSLDGYLADISSEDMQVSYVRFGMNVNVACFHDDVYCLVVPLAGEARIQIPLWQRPLDKQKAFFLPPHVTLDMNYSADCGHVVLRFPTSDFYQQVFAPVLDAGALLSDQQVRNVVHAVHYFVNACTFLKDMASIDALTNELKQDIVDAIHNESFVLENRTLVHNEKLKSAVDFIIHHPEWDYKIEELVAVTNVPIRTLYWSFKHYLGITPYRFFVVNRLKRVRLDILKHGKRMTITQIALAHGFVHLSRFSNQYKGLFGELPIETQNKYFKYSALA
ncbi:AraC family transcriptional regulator [Bermanella marisrubri]|uniref:Putative transcriptional regulator n=1 Tax=Bermanella marisrubri TaxID=207949 RepID=Q1MZH6_9GAMM|nr:helix-turn-helix transcriptional regulator [Bermanella marisrubri]EAT11435.1 putative transcriptional regulator [Oceanobacter sp. RED65] [Bermanella marisrubri]QIZ85569.1 AraC family transcriptional regulator [Bermanella marisrubri]